MRTRAARQLHAVRRVKDHGVAPLLHDRKAAHIHDQVVIAEACAAFRQQQIFIAGFLHFMKHVFHVFRRHELTFFDVDRLTRLSRAVN